MKALVTGATGFIGSHIADQLLEKGYQVRCTIRKTSNLRWLEGKNVELIEVSFSSPESLKSAVENVDYIFHVAGVVAAKSIDGFMKGNKDATKNLLEATYRFNPNIKRFLHVSSLTVNGPAGSIDEPIRETSPYNPLSKYAKSKIEAEKIAIEYMNKLPITIVRPPAVYGPRDKDIFIMFDLMNKGFIFYTGYKTHYLSLVHVTDLARGIIEAAESEKTIGEIYFVSSDEIYTWQQVYDVIKTVIKRKKYFEVRIPNFIIILAGILSQFFGLFKKKAAIFTYDKAIDMIQLYQTCSTQKAKRDFGYQQKVSLAQGIESTYKWYIDNNWLK